MRHKQITVRLDAKLYGQLQRWQVQQGCSSLSEAIRRLLQQSLQPTEMTCPTVLQRLSTLEQQVAALERQLRPPQPTLETLTIPELERLNRPQLVALARDLGIYSYKLNNPALRQAIWAAKQAIYGQGQQ
ncbi:hypothetical protein NK55_07620 [Thermosynechococcus sp. NK55a]|jgi:Arc/MetJ-type ribon-helix-helix transcriptional regulator|uniref:hypothetical protein n=1 Tax=unclassified Thermosynechococcus TaxID=2622553 RepID=UPI0003D7EEFD|nr:MULTISPECIES: hypothetical protein [unclassified Thermosynechococcus]AHB88813.1 hypothetical protein NK55_07620 [Thermosynechococcus sp. NK55a]HIK23698.1 hypothetical protein [Thermosynechococcus sp. M3746_W2019_013]